MLRRAAKELLSSSTTHALRRFQHTKPRVNLLEVGAQNTVLIESDYLRSGYKAIHKQVIKLQDNMLMATLASPAFSLAWMMVTQQFLSESVVAMASLATGAMYVADQMSQRWRLARYTRLSLLMGQTEPSESHQNNLKVGQLVAGDKFRLSFISSGIEVSGVAGAISQSSYQSRAAAETIKSMQRMVIPEVLLRPSSFKLVELTHQRWMSRLMAPLSILNILTILAKDSDERRLDDYVVLASSAYNLLDYFTGPSVDEARQRFTRALLTCKTPEAVARLLVDNKFIDDGSMDILKVWLKDRETVGVRVGRTGSPILYKEAKSSFGGPYPLQLFPKRREESCKQLEPVSRKKNVTNRP